MGRWKFPNKPDELAKAVLKSKRMLYPAGWKELPKDVKQLVRDICLFMSQKYESWEECWVDMNEHQRESYRLAVWILSTKEPEEDLIETMNEQDMRFLSPNDARQYSHKRSSRTIGVYSLVFMCWFHSLFSVFVLLLRWMSE